MSDAPTNRPSIGVSEFLERAPAQLGLEVLAGRGALDAREVSSQRIQKLGLALAGFTNYIREGRLQIVGQSEVRYLGQLAPDERREAIGRLALEKIPCVLVTKGLEPPPEFVEAAEAAGMPLLRTPLVSSVAIQSVTGFLEEALAPRAVRHGVLLDLYGLGVLIEGASGIGKSECALDLVARGHRLVADDVVEVRRIGGERLSGAAPELLREHLEIRGLGVINIRDLFGVSALSARKMIDLSIKLEKWDEAGAVDRLGIDAREAEILGVRVPQFVIPVSPGRNLSTLVETAARVQLLRSRGQDPARRFVERHAKMLEGKEVSSKR
ncbi:MAG TPA: HPr(Ser) kinase/phosphatase [Pyrinomonadaceae bacterium]|jgi:HPr kinase/phosphorylase